MRSKTSFFHKGLAANLFKRCWPVWVGYLLLMVLMFPVSVNNSISVWRAPMEEMPHQQRLQRGADFFLCLHGGCDGCIQLSL